MNLRLMCCSLVSVALLALSNGSLVQAQGKKAAKKPAAAQDESDVMSDDTDLVDDATGAATSATPEPPTQVTPPQKSYLAWMIESSGPIGMVLFGMSFVAVGLSVKFGMEMRRSKVIPSELIAEFESKLKEKKYQEAYEAAKRSPSFLGKVLAAGVANLAAGYPQATEAMQEVGEDESMKLEHKLSWLAILGTIGPLLGLVGTVEGIIASFRVIATSETQPKPSLLAAGISTSLFNTFEGLLVAIFATVAFMLLKNQMARLVLEVGMSSGSLMSRLNTVVRGGRTPSGGAQTETT